MEIAQTIAGTADYVRFRSLAIRIAHELVEASRCLTRDGSLAHRVNGQGERHLDWSKSRTAGSFGRRTAAFRRDFLLWLVDFIGVESEAAARRFDRYLDDLPFEPSASWVGIWDGTERCAPEYSLYPAIFARFLRRDLQLSASAICDLFERILSQPFRNRCPGTWKMLALARLLPDEIGVTERRRLEVVANALREATRGERRAAQLQRVISHIQSQIDVETDGRLAEAMIANLKGDDFGNRVAQRLREATPEERSQRADLLRLAAEASNAKPSARFTKSARAALGAASCTNAFIAETLDAALAARVRMRVERGEHVPDFLYTEHNIRVLKGLAWMSLHRLDDDLIDQLSRVQRKCYARIPGIGCGAEAVGNAVIWLWKQIGHAERQP